MPATEIPLRTASNLRDIGGWPAQDGRRVRRGLIYRAPALTGLDAADQNTLAALDLATVCDLRGEDERQLHPVAIPAVSVCALPVAPWKGPGLGRLLGGGDAGGIDAAALWRRLYAAYRAYALECTPQYRAIFTLLLERERLPLLLHCSAGKDRTGFGVALILAALGVAWADIVEDYLATNRLWRRELVRQAALPDDMKEVLLGAHASLLEGAFDALREAYGSVETYLAQAMGLDAAARGRLCALLLEP